MAKFQKGVSGNPSGKPKGTGIQPLLDAIKADEKKTGISFWQRVVDKSKTNPMIMATLVRKLVPDQVESTVFQGGDWRIDF